MAVRKTKAGLALKRWFKEDWKDVRTGKACGRRKGEKRGTPYCRPSKRVSSKTPRTAGEMSSSEKAKRVAQKKRLGQPAGKPRRVEAVRRKKRGTKKGSMKGYTIKSGDKRPTKKGAGMTAKGVARYRRENPGSKLQTAVTGKVKKGSKALKDVNHIVQDH